MSVAEMSKVIGRTGHLIVVAGGDTSWPVACEVIDVRQVWGNVHYRVRQVGAVGVDGDPVWVDAVRVRGVEEVTA